MRGVDPTILLRVITDLQARLMSFEEHYDKMAQQLKDAQEEIARQKEAVSNLPFEGDAGED